MIRRRSILMLLLAVLVLGIGVFNPLAAQDEDTQIANTAAVERLTEDFLNSGNLDVVDQIYAADAIHHSPMGDLTVGLRKDVRAALGMAMPDFNVTVENLMVDGEWVSVRYTFTGTFTGELPLPDGSVVPGNDAPIEMTILTLFHFDEKGRVIESWEAYDSLNLAFAMGILPAPGSE